jgi:hypothetical protein
MRWHNRLRQHLCLTLVQNSASHATDGRIVIRDKNTKRGGCFSWCSHDTKIEAGETLGQYSYLLRSASTPQPVRYIKTSSI